MGDNGIYIIESYFSQSPPSSRVRVSLKKTCVASGWPQLYGWGYTGIYWNCKGCIGKCIGPGQYRFITLLAQCHVAGSMPRCWLNFFEWKKQMKKIKTQKNWASYMPLSQLGVPSIIPANTYYVFVFELSHSFASSTWRSWLNFFVFFFRCFFRSKKIEPARCNRARAMCLS